MRYAYPYELAAQPEGGFTVTFPDLPEAVTQGEDEDEAAAMAEDALVTALSFYTDNAERLPRPSAARGRPVAYVPPLVAAKLALHDAMLAAGLVDELRALRERHALVPDMPSMRCVGYRQAWQFLDGIGDRAALRERGIAATRQLAKRQFTWLRATEATVFDASTSSVDHIAGAIAAESVR